MRQKTALASQKIGLLAFLSGNYVADLAVDAQHVPYVWHCMARKWNPRPQQLGWVVPPGPTDLHGRSSASISIYLGGHGPDAALLQVALTQTPVAAPRNRPPFWQPLVIPENTSHAGMHLHKRTWAVGNGR